MPLAMRRTLFFTAEQMRDNRSFNLISGGRDGFYLLSIFQSTEAPCTEEQRNAQRQRNQAAREVFKVTRCASLRNQRNHVRETADYTFSRHVLISGLALGGLRPPSPPHCSLPPTLYLLRI